jgi:flagellin-like hook-associated protein FlgL
MTIWFSTNIPEMRAISTFNRVSTDISEIQHRITTGQRINSGKDDPGGLIIREGLRADIKSINALQAGMTQAEVYMDAAASGMQQLLEILNGSTTDPSNGGLLKILDDPLLTLEQKATQAADYMKLYDGVINTTVYNGQKLLVGGEVDATDKVLLPLSKTYRLGGDDGTAPYTLTVSIVSLASSDVGGIGDYTSATTPIDTLNISVPLVSGKPKFADEDELEAYRASVAEALKTVSTAFGNLGMNQQIASTNQKLLDSRLTSVTASEGRISNADIAVESSRMARAELLAQNAMSSILYTRRYAAFAVGSLFG